MKKFFKVFLPLLIVAAMIAALGGCSNRQGGVTPSAKPSANPGSSPSAGASDEPMGSEGNSAEPSMEPSIIPSGDPSADPSPDPSAGPSESADPLFPTDAIEGFMEGEVVDPENAPELMRFLEARYTGMGVQSITYKLFEERQAYYVVLQGEGEASHPVYVFADGTVMDDDM